jgi:hypothetical protein
MLMNPQPVPIAENKRPENKAPSAVGALVDRANARTTAEITVNIVCAHHDAQPAYKAAVKELLF